MLRLRRHLQRRQAEAARDLGDRKAAHVLAAEPDAYASANPGCLVQVAQALGRAGESAACPDTPSSSSMPLSGA